MERNLETYILENSTPEDPVLEELYRQTHLRFVNPNMVSGHIQGRLLEMISKMIHPENILEIGTFTGYSAICLSKGLRHGGRLLTIEINDEFAEFARSYFCRAGVESKITQLTGDALEIIPGLDQTFDLVFIDGDKREYFEYFKQIFEKVKQGGFILVDNVFWGGKVIEKNTRDPQAIGIIEFNESVIKDNRVENIILPIRDGLMFIRKK